MRRAKSASLRVERKARSSKVRQADSIRGIFIRLGYFEPIQQSWQTLFAKTLRIKKSCRQRRKILKSWLGHRLPKEKLVDQKLYYQL